MPHIQNLASFKLPSNFRGRPGWYVQIWMIVQSVLFGCSPQFMYGWRRWLLRCFGAKVGKGVLIRPTARVTYPWKVEIGDNAWIGDHAVVYSLGPISIGPDVVVSQRSYLCAGTHDYTASTFDMRVQPIRIESEAWVASDVFVAPGVTIGRGAVIGARSSVFKDMPQEMICVGNPCRPVRPRLEDQRTEAACESSF